MNEFLIKIADILDKDEVIVTELQCLRRTIAHKEGYIPGRIVATDKKILFYSFNIGDKEFIEIFEYEDILFIGQKEENFNDSIIIYCNNESIKLSNIAEGDTKKFIEVVKGRIKI